jgi:Icc-related predicted phosphoesterase
VLGRRRKRDDGGWRLFYASDLHGSDLCFKKFVNAAKFFDARVLVLGGDLAGKAVVPIVDVGGHWEAELIGQHYRLEAEDELAELEQAVSYNGFYPYRTTPEELERLRADPAARKAVFDRLMRETLARWLALAEERLSGSGVTLVAIAGNDDELELDELLRGSPVVRFNDETPVEVDGYEIVGLSWANPTPWSSPRELPEDELYSRVCSVLEPLTVGQRTIFNFHVPPYATGLDDAPELDERFAVKMSSGQPKLVPVGSTAIRRAIEEFQPGLGLHGHIHESRSLGRIGDSVVINPGSRYNEGVLDGALITLGADGVEDYKLVSG